MTAIDPPTIDPPAAGQHQRIAQHGHAQIDEGAGGGGGTARVALPRRLAGDVRVIFVGLADRAAPVDAHPQFDLAERGADLDPAADAAGRHVILVERLGDGGARRIGAGEARRELALLHIGQGLEPPMAVAHQPDAGIGAGGGVGGAVESARAFVAQHQHVGLQFGVGADREDHPSVDAALAIGRRLVDRAALARDDRDEAVAPRIGAREGREARAQFARQRGIGIDRIAAAVEHRRLDRGQFLGRRARQLDRAGECAGAIDAAAAAARDADLAEARGIERGERHPAAERIDLRHAVENHQGARRCVAAEPAQGRALAGRVGRARVRPAILREAGDVAQHILQPAAGGIGQPIAIDRDDVIGGIAHGGGQPPAGDDDLCGRIRGKGCGHGRSIAEPGRNGSRPPRICHSLAGGRCLLESF